MLHPIGHPQHLHGYKSGWMNSSVTAQSILSGSQFVYWIARERRETGPLEDNLFLFNISLRIAFKIIYLNEKNDGAEEQQSFKVNNKNTWLMTSLALSQ